MSAPNRSNPDLSKLELKPIGHRIIFEHDGFSYLIVHMYGGKPEIRALKDQPPEASTDMALTEAVREYDRLWGEDKIADELLALIRD